MVRFRRGYPSARRRRRRQTSRFEFAAGQGRFGLFAEPGTLLVPPLSLFGLSGELGNRLLVHSSVPLARSDSRSLDDAAVNGLKSLSSRICGNRTVGAVVEHCPYDDENSPIRARARHPRAGRHAVPSGRHYGHPKQTAGLHPLTCIVHTAHGARFGRDGSGRLAKASGSGLVS